MKYKFIKQVDSSVSVYDGKTASTGDILDYTGSFAEKADRNPDFQKVTTVRKKSNGNKNTSKK